MGADGDETVWFDAPARHFTESSPIGNGRLGAMVFGGVESETIVVCESGMWSGSRQDADRPNAAASLPEIRRLLFSGDVHAAEALVNKQFTCAGAGSGLGRGARIPYGSYQELATLNLAFRSEAEGVEPQERAYRRKLRLDAAEVAISYARGRSNCSVVAFASAPDQVIVYRIEAADGSELDFSARVARAERATVTRAGDDDLETFGQLDDGRGGEDGVRFCGRIRVIADGGQTTYREGALDIAGAKSATILVAGATQIASFAGSQRDAREAARETLDAAAKLSFAELHRRHVADYQRYYNRVRLQLASDAADANSAVADLPTPQRLARAWEGATDPGLAALYFNFGRYLLISSSRPGGFPANLQGLWAQGVQTPWNGDWHLNVNVQMNYWPAESCHLPELHAPLFALIESLVEPGRRTARKYYDAPGWCAHVLANPWGFTAPGEAASWGATSTGGTWLAWHLWQHYQFTQDREFLARVYPTLRGAADFALGVLVTDPRTGKLVTAPSNSPENSYYANSKPAHLCVGATMDMQLVRAILTATADAAEILDRDAEFIETARAAAARLLPTRIGSDGRILEWNEEVREVDPAHRHISHLWGLYPGDEIDRKTSPKLATAARKTLEARGDDGTGWSLAYKLALWARLGDGERAAKLLGRHLMPVSNEERDIRFRGGAYPNLFDAHPPFQIDGNFGGAAAIAEMLVQSRLSGGATSPRAAIDLLPALPLAWNDGEFTGLCARGGFVVDAKWTAGRLERTHIAAKIAMPVTVCYGEQVAEFQLTAGNKLELGGDLQPVTPASAKDQSP